MYSTPNNQTTKKIYDLLDSIQKKLSGSNQVHKNINRTHYPNINLIPSNETSYILRNQPQNITTDNIRYMNIIPNQSESFNQNVLSNNNNNNNIPNEFELKKMIKEEFNKLISSYQMDIDNKISTIDNKINDISNDCLNIKSEQNNLSKQYINLINNNKNNINDNNNMNLDIENSLNEIRQLMTGYITQNEFGKKYKEILEQINSSKNSNLLEIKKLNENYNKLKNDFDDINQKIQELKINYENIKF